MDERKSRPGMKEYVSASRKQFFNRLAKLQVGKAYSPQELMEHFDLKPQDGLTELLAEFASWSPVENGYQLLQKIELPQTAGNLTEKQKGMLTKVEEFFALQPKGSQLTAREIVQGIGHVAENETGQWSAENEMSNFLRKLERKGWIKIRLETKPQKVKYEWIKPEKN
jgi:hypothetical protein